MRTLPGSEDAALAVASLEKVGDGVDPGRDVKRIVRGPVRTAIEQGREAFAEARVQPAFERTSIDVRAELEALMQGANDPDRISSCRVLSWATADENAPCRPAGARATCRHRRWAAS